MNQKEEGKIEIKKGMTIAELLKLAPKAMEVFFKHGMYCIGCPIASGETLEEAALAHGLDPEEIIKEIKEALK